LGHGEGKQASCASPLAALSIIIIIIFLFCTSTPTAFNCKMGGCEEKQNQHNRWQ